MRTGRASAVGLAVAEGKLSVDDDVLGFFPGSAPAELSSTLRAMRVSDLLRMSTGHETEPPRPADQSWTKAFLAYPVPFKPGTHFLYNTSATYMLSAKLCLYETPYIFTIGLKYSGQELRYDIEANVAFGPTKEPPLVGQSL